MRGSEGRLSQLGLMASLDRPATLTGSPIVDMVDLYPLGGTMSTIGLAHLAAKGRESNMSAR